MFWLRVLALLLSPVTWVHAIPLVSGDFKSPAFLNVTRTPLVIWHGLGDTYSGEGIIQFMKLIEEIHPGIFIHSISVAKDPDDDRKAGWFGNINEQLPVVAEQLAIIPELQGGFDAIGFSQGGQFLRAYNEMYNDPPIRNLITFGSQHMGIAETPACSRTFDLLCRAAKLATATRGVYSTWVQSNIIPAQYFRNPDQLPDYLSSNHFLTTINNEIVGKRNQTFAKNFASLENLILVLFTKDKTVVPKESSWFGSYASFDNNATIDHSLVSMRHQPLYLEDWIGLKSLDEAGRVKLVSCEGEHMQIRDDCWQPLVKQYVGGPRWNLSAPALFVQY